MLTINDVSQIVSMAVGFVFAYSVGSKLLNVPKFVAGIRDYQLLPRALAAPVAGLLIGAEVLIALTHLIYTALLIVVPATIALLSVFLVVTVRLLRSTDQQRPPCMCFGTSSEETVGVSSLVRIGLLLAAEFALYLLVYVTPASGGIEGTTNVTATLVIGALLVTLLAWCFALPKFLRALHVVRT